jgi:hypothetical protein
MNPQAFVEEISRVMKAGLSGLISNISSPPGKRPKALLLRISEFYNRLNEHDKRVFEEALALASRQSVNAIFSILDGDLAIEPIGKKGELKLYHSDGTRQIRINDPDQAPLSEIFRSCE